MPPDTLPDEGLEHEAIPGGLEPHETAALDQMEAGLRDSGPGYGGGSRLSNGLKSVGQFVAQKKKPLIGGGVGAGIIGLILGGSALLGPFELLHLFNNIVNDVRMELNKEVNKEATKVEEKVIQKQIDKATRKDTGTDTGKPLEEEAGKVDFKTVEPEFEQNGVKGAFDAQGNLTGLTDETTGKPISQADLAGNDPLQTPTGLESNPSVENGLQTSVDVLDTGDLVDLRPRMANADGASFSLPTVDSPDKDIEVLMEEETIDGISPGELAALDGETAQDVPTESLAPPGTPTPTPPPETPAEQAATRAADENSSGVGGWLGRAINKALERFKAGDTSDAALNAGVAEAEVDTAGANLNVVGPATIYCTVQNSVVGAKANRKPTLINRLMRHGSMMMTIVHQMKANKLTGKMLGQTLSFLGGDSSAKNKDGTPAEGSLSWDKAASFQRDTGHTPTTANPDLDPLANPGTSPSTVLSSAATSISKFPGSKLTCAALTSPFSIVIQTVGGAVSAGEAVVNLVDGETAEAAQLAAQAALIQTIMQTLVKPTLKVLTNMAVTGAEDAVQWTNISDAGLRLATSDFARSMGAAPITDATASALSLQTNAELVQQESHKPLLTQWFDVNDPYSLASRVLNHVPTNPASTVSRTMVAMITNPFSQLKNFAALVTPTQADSTSCGTSSTVNPYCFELYSFNNGNKYDPFGNEDYLLTLIVTIHFKDPATGKFVTQQIPALPALGDPSALVNNPGQADTNNGDLLHCYINPQDQLQSGSDGAKVCGDLGQLIPTSSTTQYNPPDLNAIFCAGRDPCTASYPADLLQRYGQYMLDLHVMRDLVARTNAN